MIERQFSDREVVGGNHYIEFHFVKDERNFRLSIRKRNGCSYIKVEEQNNDGCLFHVCGGYNEEKYNKLQTSVNNILIELYELTNNLMNTL